MRTISRLHSSDRRSEATGTSTRPRSLDEETREQSTGLAQTLKLSNDPFSVEKVRDIVGLYLNLPEHAVVLCVDEKSQAQALDRTEKVLPMDLGYVKRCTHDDIHHGTKIQFEAVHAATGKLIARCAKRRRHQE